MIISISHEVDLDGLGSQAILKRYHEQHHETATEEMKFIHVHYTNFIEKFSELSISQLRPSKIIISDMGFNDEFRELFHYFRDVKEKANCKIYWYDHHVVDEAVQKIIIDLIEMYINDPERCTAEIIKEEFLPDDPVAEKISIYARDIDFRTERFPIASKLQSIIAYNRGLDNYDNRMKLIDFLSKGIFKDEWLDEQFKSLEEWERRESSNIEENAQMIEIDNIGFGVVSFAEIGGGRITITLKKDYPEAKFCIGIDTRYNEIIIYSEFLNCKDVAKHFNGGGHKNRAGFKYEHLFIEGGILNPMFIEDLKPVLELLLVKH